MAKTNYRKHYEEAKASQDVVETTEVTEVVEPQEEAVEEKQLVIEETIPKKEKGYVVSCDKLNIRKNPSKLAQVLCVIPKGSEVEIDKENSTNEFYKVNTIAGVEGYCMKDFIDIK